MIWFWYVARSNELMLDVDGSRPGTSTLGPTRARLAALVRGHYLTLKENRIWIYPSVTPGHFHIIIPLAQPLAAPVRYALEIQLRSDLYRGINNIMRAEHGYSAPGLLIAPAEWTGFYRSADDSCRCDGKHTYEIIKSCPSSRRLRGTGHAVTFFGNLESGIRFPALRAQAGPMDLDDFITGEKIENGGPKISGRRNRSS